VVTARVVLLQVSVVVLRITDCVVAMLLSVPLWLYPESGWPWRILFGFDHAIEEVRAKLVEARHGLAAGPGPDVGDPDVQTHVLKTYPEYFEEVLAGRKPFELRRADRDFRVGDDLVLAEYSPEIGLSGRTTRRKITYILLGSNCITGGLVEGFCILGLGRLP
jgi:hypothetical protein